jgi:hypothetical protein
MTISNRVRVFAVVAAASLGGLVAALGAPLKW